MQIESLNDIWAAVGEECKKQMSEIAFNVWIKDLHPLELENGEIVLGINSDYKKGIVESNYMGLLKNAVKTIMGIDIKINIVLQDESGHIKADAAVDSGDTTSNYTFDNFIVGACNRYAHAASMQVALKPAVSYNPLVIWGNSGVGKTHLLLAIKNSIKEKYPHYKIEYLSGEDFTNQMIKAIGEGRIGIASIDGFREKYRGADVLLMDDIHFIAGKESTQEEFFNTFNALISKNKQIVVTLDRPPKDVKTLDERIRSRLEQGLFADITPPDFETRVGIINAKAKLLNIEIDNKIVYYIAENIKMNTRQLEGVVKKIKMYFDVENTTSVPMTVVQNFIRDVVNDTQPEPIKIEKIISEVARTYNVEESEILSSRRTADLVLARHAAMYIARETTELSYQDIGEAFGKDHSSVIHATKNIEKNIKNNSYERSIIEDIIKNLKSEL